MTLACSICTFHSTCRLVSQLASAFYLRQLVQTCPYDAITENCRPCSKNPTAPTRTFSSSSMMSCSASRLWMTSGMLDLTAIVACLRNTCFCHSLCSEKLHITSDIVACLRNTCLCSSLCSQKLQITSNIVACLCLTCFCRSLCSQKLHITSDIVACLRNTCFCSSLCSL